MERRIWSGSTRSLRFMVPGFWVLVQQPVGHLGRTKLFAATHNHYLLRSVVTTISLRRWCRVKQALKIALTGARWHHVMVGRIKAKSHPGPSHLHPPFPPGGSESARFDFLTAETGPVGPTPNCQAANFPTPAQVCYRAPNPKTLSRTLEASRPTNFLEAPLQKRCS